VTEDRWSRWLLGGRDAGDAQQRAASLEYLAPIRDRVLAGAEPLAGADVIDVGAGDGLIALGALDHVGRDGTVTFCDVSPALVEHCRGLAGDDPRARFAVAAAEDLGAIPDGSVDVVTTRSVLIYVTDKARAFAEFHRVLRPGGRVSLFEPINALMQDRPGRFLGYEAEPDLAARVRAAFGEDETAKTAMMGFDDRDLARLAEEAGFAHVHVECRIDLEPGTVDQPVSFEALIDGSPNPNARTVREAIDAVLTPPERERFLAELRESYDAGRRMRRHAEAYLVARK
jgi:ubiquinone/menaquinone biosynthesis C-methylase UbiE